jgi:hypothetical protein
MIEEYTNLQVIIKERGYSNSIEYRRDRNGKDEKRNDLNGHDINRQDSSQLTAIKPLEPQANEPLEPISVYAN